VAHAVGKVLEIGSGTGLNLPFFPSSCSLISIDLNSNHQDEFLKKRISAPCKVEYVRMDAQHLAFPDNSFDSLIITLALCTINDPDSALLEFSRVLKPGGSFLVIEHIFSDQPVIAELLDWLTPAWKKIAHGCHLNRRTNESIPTAGFVPGYVRYLAKGLLMFSIYHKGAVESK
jgi:ubiquinone/menaquinone biosynthesis C-methylase UbiE